MDVLDALGGGVFRAGPGLAVRIIGTITPERLEVLRAADAIVLEEMGRVLLCAPYFSSVVLAANAILNAGTEDQKAALLPGIASGETIATLAFTEPNGKWDAAGIEMVAQGSGDSYTLDGTKMFVIDGHLVVERLRDELAVVGELPVDEPANQVHTFEVEQDLVPTR